MNEAATVAPRALRFRASKFDPVRLRADAVVRDRLLQRLAAAANTPIVLISASAGYGKSTLAAQWSAHCQRPVAWINIDRGDNDPVVFLNSLAHALDRIDPLDPQLLEELSGTLPRLEDVVLPAFAAELDRLAPFELILDDAHELTGPTSLAALEFLFDGVRAGSQVVLVTRIDLALPFARRRVSGDLFEIRADELALNVDETRELVAFNGKHLSAEMLELLHERTEGWPAGIALALHTLDESAPVDDIAQTLSGGHREIADYLTEVILYRETEERRRFLLATSVLTQMTPPLCDAVLGVTGSSDVLAELERSNSFVIALDDHRGWYRYHHLFAELLRTELERVDPELAVACLSRAATWYEQSGDPGEAFRCAHECGDLKLAGRIALASIDSFRRSGQLETVKLWLLDCTDEEISSDPQLAIVAAWVHLHLGDSEGAQRFVAAVEGEDLDVPSADGATSLRSSLASFRTGLAPHGIHGMLADAEFVCGAEGKARTRWLFGGFLAAGIATLLLDRPEEAVETFHKGLTLTSGHPEFSHVKILCLGYLAFALAETGDQAAAWDAADEASALSADERLGHTLSGGVAYTARAMTLAGNGNFDQARLDLASARHIRHLFRGARWLNADMNVRMGNISVDLGDPPSARGHADAARVALHGYPDPGTLPRRLARTRKTDRLPHRSPTDAGRDPDPSLPPDPSLDQGDRRTSSRVPHNREEPCLIGLRQARRHDAIGRDRAVGSVGPSPRQRAA